MKSKDNFQEDKKRDLFDLDFPKNQLDENVKIGIAFGSDTFPNKCNLNYTFKTEDMKFYTFTSIQRAEKLISAHQLYTELSMQEISSGLSKIKINAEGCHSYIEACKKLLFSHNLNEIREGKIAGIQTVSGTEALRIGIEYLKPSSSNKIYLTYPTYGNHLPIAKACGLEIINYKYLNQDMTGIDWDSVNQILYNAQKNSIFLLHACCHNPSGIDPNLEEWRSMAKLMKKKELIPFFDNSFFGIKTGDIEKDNLVFQVFIEEGLQILIAHSFSKIMSLYGERVGALLYACSSKVDATKAQNRLENMIMNYHPSSSLFAAHLIATILSTPHLLQEWQKELYLIHKRIENLRRTLVEKLMTTRIDRNWNVILHQKGFFTLLPLKEAECIALTEKCHIYLLSNGRISIGALNYKKIDQLVEGINRIFFEEIHPKL